MESAGVSAHPEKAAEAEDRIGNIASELVDHQALNRSDLAAIGSTHRRTLDSVAGDQAMGLTG